MPTAFRFCTVMKILGGMAITLIIGYLTRRLSKFKPLSQKIVAYEQLL